MLQVLYLHTLEGQAQPALTGKGVTVLKSEGSDPGEN